MFVMQAGRCREVALLTQNDQNLQMTKLGGNQAQVRQREQVQERTQGKTNCINSGRETDPH